MKKATLLLIPSLILWLTVPSCAQGHLFNLSWNIGFPLADLKDFLTDEDYSLGGFGLDYRHFVRDNISVGGYFAWDFFNGTSEEMLSFDNTDITGQQRLFVNYFPIMVNSHYYLGVDDGIRPYFGAGLGVVRTLQRTSIGTFNIQNNNWHFGLYPEVGVIFPVFEDKNISLGAKYHTAFETDDSFTYSYFSLNVGISAKFFE